jgi:hypothetical protein
VSRWDVEDLVGNVPEEGGDLASRDLTAEAGGGVVIYCGRVIHWRAKAGCPLYYVEAHLRGAHPAGVGSVPVRERLPIVVVLLLANAKGGERGCS